MNAPVVRAMFTCSEKVQTTDGFRLKFHAVAGGSPEAEKYFKYSPYGELELGTINPAAAKHFEPGKSYYLDFTPAD